MCNRFGFAKGMKTLEVVERRGGKDGGEGGATKKHASIIVNTFLKIQPDRAIFV